MRPVVFHLTGEGSREVWINPEVILSFEPRGAETRIFLAHSLAYTVAETPAEVAQVLELEADDASARDYKACVSCQEALEDDEESDCVAGDAEAAEEESAGPNSSVGIEIVPAIKGDETTKMFEDMGK